MFCSECLPNNILALKHDAACQPWHDGPGHALRLEKSRPGGMTFMTGMWRPTRRRARSTGSSFLSYLRA